MIPPSQLLVEAAKIVTGLAPITPSSSTPDYVSLKAYNRLTILISILNGTTVTGSAITVKQATDVAATGEKAVTITKAWRNIDAAAADALAEFAVASGTFTTDTTNSKQLLYVIEIDEDDLDIDGGFDCVRVGTGNAANMTACVLYILWPAKYAKATPPSAIVD